MHEQTMKLATDVECSCIQLENVETLLHLFTECLENETTPITVEQPHSTEVFLRRLPRLTVLIGTIEEKLATASRELNATCEKLYAFAREVHQSEGV